MNEDKTEYIKRFWINGKAGLRYRKLCNKNQALFLKPDILIVDNRIFSISKPFPLQKADSWVLF